MVAEDRRSRLLELVRREGFTSLPDLAESLAVSESTAQRTPGRRFTPARRPSCHILTNGNRPSGTGKKALAELAAGLIDDADTVLLDGRSTSYELAQLLVQRPLHRSILTTPLSSTTLKFQTTEKEPDYAKHPSDQARDLRDRRPHLQKGICVCHRRQYHLSDQRE